MYLNTNKKLFLGKNPIHAMKCTKEEFIQRLCAGCQLISMLRSLNETHSLRSDIFCVQNPEADALVKERLALIERNKEIEQMALDARYNHHIHFDENLTDEFDSNNTSVDDIYSKIEQLRFNDMLSITAKITPQFLIDNLEKIDPRDIVDAISLYVEEYALYDEGGMININEHHWYYDESELSHYFEPTKYNLYTDFYDINGVCMLGHLANMDCDDFAPFFQLLYFDENGRLSVYVPQYGNFVDSVCHHNTFNYISGSDFFETSFHGDTGLCFGYLHTIMDDIGYEEGELGTPSDYMNAENIDMELKFYAEYNTDYMFKEVESNLQ